MKNEKWVSMLGIAMKAGKVASGEFKTEEVVRGHKAYLVLLSEDASDNTKKKFTNMCEYHNVPIYIKGTKDDLGHAIGRQMRASLAVTDEGIAKTIEKCLL